MKIIYLQSPYKGIYHYLEQSIIHAFQEHEIEVIHIPYPYKRKKIQTIIKENTPQFLFTLVGRWRNDLFQLLTETKIQKIGWFLEDPYYIEETVNYAPVFNLILTVEKSATAFYNKLDGNHSFYLPLGYNPSIYFPQPNNNPQYKSDICLVGYPYSNRVLIVEKILKETNWNVTVVGGKWATPLKKWANRNRINCINHWISPEKVALYYSNSKIILNPHRPMENKKDNLTVIPSSPNNRCFEAAACKVLQVCDYRQGVEELFPTDHQIPTYKEVYDVIDIIDQYLNEYGKRMEVADKSFQVVKEQHTFYHRVKQILQLQKNI